MRHCGEQSWDDVVVLNKPLGCAHSVVLGQVFKVWNVLVEVLVGFDPLLLELAAFDGWIVQLNALM